MIFSLLLCKSPWKQQHLTIRMNIQVANQPFLLRLEEPSNTLNLLFWQRLFTVESLAARITACSSHLMKNSKKHGWKTSVGQQILLLFFLFLCRSPGLQPKLGIIVLLVLINLSIVGECQMCFSQKSISSWSPTYRMTLTFLFSMLFHSKVEVNENSIRTQLGSKQYNIVTFLVHFSNFQNRQKHCHNGKFFLKTKVWETLLIASVTVTSFV